MTDSEGNEIGKLFVGGLSQATNNASLRIYFSRFGEVDDAVVMMDNKTGRSRGFGYVKYREPESVNLALQAKPHILDGKEVDAKQCNINMKGRNRRSLKIFVGGIGLDQDTESIKNFFRQFGRVTDVNLMMDSNKQRHRGFAFVGFEDESVVKRLIGLHYVVMNTKQVEIKAMEPPNFGRKLGPNACLTTAALINGAGSTEAHGFDTTADVSSMLATPFVNSVPYVSGQTAGMACLPTNMLGPTRPNPPNLYEQSSGSFNPSLENLYPTGGYLQPINSMTKSADNLQNPITYMGSKPSVPLMLTNSHYQTTAINQSTSSLCAPIPYQLLSPTYLTSTQPHSNALVKSTINWPITTVQAQCSANLGPSNNLLSCSAFPAAHTTVLTNPSTTDMTNGIGSILTPYYTLCPPYTTIPIPSEQTMPYAIQQHANSVLGTTVPPMANETNGTGEKSPALASEINTSNKQPYQTIVMSPPTGVPNQILNPPNQTFGQNLWNSSQANLLYSPLAMSWSVPQQSWPSQMNLLTQQVHASEGAELTKEQKTNTVSEETQSEEDRAMPTDMDINKPSSAKASGDGMDVVAPSCEGTVELMEREKTKIVTAYLSVNPTKESAKSGYWSTAINAAADRANGRNSEGDHVCDEKPVMSNTALEKQGIQNPSLALNTVKALQGNPERDRTELQCNRSPRTLPSCNTIPPKAGVIGQSSQVDDTITSTRTSESEYASRFNRKTGLANIMEVTMGGKKELQAVNRIELECQGPAGAAGDFNQPIYNTTYSGYHLTH